MPGSLLGIESKALELSQLLLCPLGHFSTPWLLQKCHHLFIVSIKPNNFGRLHIFLGQKYDPGTSVQNRDPNLDGSQRVVVLVWPGAGGIFGDSSLPAPASPLSFSVSQADVIGDSP